ncbi:MAG: tRNA 2-thiouridine(34) synthase MnmA [Candidatus Omnitrophica bacterium]|nr:tRNA 2-thiouridine(34) synthase MnmA [Candidatus Omnitrophota bacterium]MCM8769202.1 tRNA 2-thiouridine(34) synthase MnmA [Candidatus Omnitrophota bacterium]
MSVAVGLSGGVDSAVTALLLKESGYQVIGLFMKTWNESKQIPGCWGPDRKALEAARQVATHLGIPFFVIDMSASFAQDVLTYFRKEYLRGRTPNPCVVCNHRLKFGSFLQAVKETGEKFDYFATGHYVKKEYNRMTQRYMLKKALDKKKDQSYFLYLLTQKQLKSALFPLGDYSKQQVRELAITRGLPVSQRKESQDFLPGRKQLLCLKAASGPILSIEGKHLGIHRGIFHYTIGQRRGLGIATGEPLYVLRIEPESNTIFVGPAKKCWRKELRIASFHYLSVRPFQAPQKVMAKIRSTQPAAVAILYPETARRVRLVFDQPQWAVTPGQSAVVYQGDILVGGGIIDRERFSPVSSKK